MRSHFGVGELKFFVEDHKKFSLKKYFNLPKKGLDSISFSRQIELLLSQIELSSEQY